MRTNFGPFTLDPATRQLLEGGRAIHLSGPSMRIGYIVMDAMGRHQAKNPFTQVKVRQAVNHAIDRDAIATRIVRGRAGALHTACHPSQFGCTPWSDEKVSVPYRRE